MDNSLEKKRQKNSDLSFEYTQYFIRQWCKFNPTDKKLILRKFKLIRLHPYRFSRLENYKNVYKIKLTIENRYSRLLFSLNQPTAGIVKILGVFARRLQYKDFERLFKQLRK